MFLILPRYNAKIFLDTGPAKAGTIQSTFVLYYLPAFFASIINTII